jgi:heat shock protein HspQ
MSEAKFNIGQIIEHKLFNYRGVIFDVDDSMQLPEEWYEQVAKSRPPKDKPWYHVMVDNYIHTTYVAEQNLIASAHSEQINHPQLNDYFDKFENNSYQVNSKYLN